MAVNLFEILLGSTEIGHDSLDSMETDDCTGAGCFQRAVHYNVSIRQMTALARLSKDCIQPFQVQVSANLTQPNPTQPNPTQPNPT